MFYKKIQKENPMEPLVGIEPTTHALRMRCSTPELQWHSLCGARGVNMIPLILARIFLLFFQFCKLNT